MVTCSTNFDHIRSQVIDELNPQKDVAETYLVCSFIIDTYDWKEVGIENVQLWLLQ